MSLVEHFIAFIATVLLKAKNLDSVYNMTLKLLRNNQFMHLYEEKIVKWNSEMEYVIKR